MQSFIKEIEAKNGFLGVFEDDGETGYLYSYSPVERKIYMDLIIYERKSGVLEPSEQDVELIYDNNTEMCGVYVWGKLRGYIVFPDKERRRLKFSSKEDVGIEDSILPETKTDIKRPPTGKDSLETKTNFLIEDRKIYWKKLGDKLSSERDS